MQILVASTNVNMSTSLFQIKIRKKIFYFIKKKLQKLPLTLDHAVAVRGILQPISLNCISGVC